MVGTTPDDEERLAREKLLARRNSARAIQKAKTNSRDPISGAPSKKKQPSIAESKKHQRDTITEVSSSPGKKKDRKSQKQVHEKRRDTKMSSNRGEASSAAAPPRGRHHYRDEFGRQPPPHWDYPPNGHYHRGPPSHFRDRRDPYRDEGRWERDRGMHNALPPHPRSRRPRSPPRHREDRRDYRDRRYRSRRSRSRSYSSRSRSRSFSSRSSSSSFSSSESDSGRSYDSRSLSRSRSRSYSRSPSPQSPAESKKQHEKEQNFIDEKKTDEGSKDMDHSAKPREIVVKNNSKEAEEKKEERNDAQSPSSSKGSSQKKRSRSPSASEDSRSRLSRRGRDQKRKGSRKYRRSRSRSRSSSISRSRSPASYSSSSSRSYSRDRRERRSKRRRRKEKSKRNKHVDDGSSKDQRTIFVSQLVMRTTERDLKKYFKRKVGCKVNDVILLRDRRNPRNHKGSAYVEVGRIEDVAKALAVSGQPPNFQRFPILVKASEAEKNHSNGGGTSATVNLMTNMEGPISSTVTAVTPTRNGHANGSKENEGNYSTSFLPPLRDENGRLIESQRVYVGGLDPSIRQDHLYALFSPFGNLKKVQLQCLPNTQVSRGYAFLTFHDPKVSNLAIRTMAGQMLGGRPMKTGWANQNQRSPASIASGCTIVTSDQFPENASELTQKALAVLAQMTGGSSMQPTQSASLAASNPRRSPSNMTALTTKAEQELEKAMGLVGTSTTASTQSIPTVADARASMGGTVAEARASLAADVAARQLAAATAVASAAAEAKSAFIGNTSNGPTCHLLVRNMFDKDEETDPGWEGEIKEDFLEECSKFGKIEHAKIMHLEPGGKIYATFSTIEGAKACAENLAGRWFDKRQLYVEYMPEANPP